MKRMIFLYKAILCLAVMLSAALFSGCGRLHEDLQPCPRGLRLKMYYDYNIKFADALPAEVRNVSVYVFDPETGEAIDRVDVPVGNVREHEFEVNLDHLDPGRYDFLVWCYGDSDEHFTVNPTKSGYNRHKDHTCLINEDTRAPEAGHQTQDIGRLYHGRLLNVECPEQEIATYEVPLIKNTNVVRLVLQHLSGEYLDPADFDISLSSDNGHMDHDNSLISGYHRIYHPWAVESGTTDMERIGENGTRAITSVSALVAEHTIGRIVPETGVNLRVRNRKTGEDIINIPFIDYALLVKGNYNRPMSDQEYLDRQDEYNLVFFLDNNLRWMNQYIYINSWRIVLQNDEL